MIEFNVTLKYINKDQLPAATSKKNGLGSFCLLISGTSYLLEGYYDGNEEKYLPLNLYL